MKTVTVLELRRHGPPIVFHRRGHRAWQHRPEDPVLLDLGERRPCPVCTSQREPRPPEGGGGAR